MARVDPLLRDEMRELYEAGVPVSVIANRCRVAINTVKLHANKGGWCKPQIELAEPSDEIDEPEEGRQLSVSDQLAILEAGPDMRALARGHQKEWKEIERIRRDALKAYKDDTFKPKDAPETWNSRDRLTYAAKLFAMYNTACNALMVAQEGERRSHGFDYRDQKKAAQAEGRDHARQAELMDELVSALEVLTEGKIIDGEWHDTSEDVGGAKDEAPPPGGTR